MVAVIFRRASSYQSLLKPPQMLKEILHLCWVLPKKLFVLIFLLKLTTVSAAAQTGSFWEDSDLRPFTTGGSIGLSASTYMAKGIENRRPPGVLQTHANINFSTFGLRSGLQLNYSTDASGFRQNMNALSYGAGWRWLAVQAGDVTARFSNYGLNGTTIRGGYLRAKPGNWQIELIGGKSRRAVRPSLVSAFREPSFDQWAFGAKTGIENRKGDYLFLSTFYAQDYAASLKGESSELKAQENLTVTPDFRINLFNQRVSLESQVTLSVLTRDLEGTPFSSSDLGVPEFLITIYQPRSSTHLNYAGTALARFQSGMFDLDIGYERIQPGFTSLGRGTMRNDRETISLSPAFRFLQNRLSVRSDITFGRDNLMGNRLQTQSNTDIATQIQMSVSERLQLTASYNLLLNDVTFHMLEENLQPEGAEPEGVRSTNTTGGTGPSQVSHHLMLQPSLTMMGEEWIHHVSFSGAWMSMTSQFGMTEPGGGYQSIRSDSYIGMASYTLTLPTGITLNSSANLLSNKTDMGLMRNFGTNVGTGYALFNRKLTLALNIGLNRSRFERTSPSGSSDLSRMQQISGGLNGTYQLTNRDSLNISLRLRNNRAKGVSGNSFTENEGSFKYQRTF